MGGPIQGEYRCTDCGQRVYPYSILEIATEAPEPGAQGGTVLLSSFNTRNRQRGEDWVYAWCRRCQKMDEATYVAGHELVLEFLQRRGVTVRIPGHTTQAKADWLSTRLEQRRLGSATTIPLRRRRRARAS